MVLTVGLSACSQRELQSIITEWNAYFFQFNFIAGDINLDFFHNSNDITSRLPHPNQAQQQRLNNLHSNGIGHVYPENMSKFFDFHKNQQQQQQQSQQNQYILNGLSTNVVPPSDPMNIASLLENSRFNTNFMDQHANGGFCIGVS
jgi:CCR4-NOT transcription complex subunit 4